MNKLKKTRKCILALEIDPKKRQIWHVKKKSNFKIKSKEN